MSFKIKNLVVSVLPGGINQTGCSQSGTHPVHSDFCVDRGFSGEWQELVNPADFDTLHKMLAVALKEMETQKAKPAKKS
jgi:hypothetical protein